jgi:hypothetical protein
MDSGAPKLGPGFQQVAAGSFWADADLLAQTEFLNYAFVAIGIVLLQIVQKAATFTDQHKKAAARTVVFLVRFEVLCQLTNAFA